MLGRPGGPASWARAVRSLVRVESAPYGVGALPAFGHDGTRRAC